jgi:hypothetical protein
MKEPWPDDFGSSYEKAKSLQSALKAEIAKQITPRLNSKLQSMRQENYEDKRKICRWTNEVLKSLGLAIKATTGEPSILVANPSNREGQGRFRLNNHANKLSDSHLQLWPLELIEDRPRAEPLSAVNRALDRNPRHR